MFRIKGIVADGFAFRVSLRWMGRSIEVGVSSDEISRVLRRSRVAFVFSKVLTKPFVGNEIRSKRGFEEPLGGH